MAGSRLEERFEEAEVRGGGRLMVCTVELDREGGNKSEREKKKRHFY